ncbi:hypothetical protein ScPMuIL_001718 [Solemya velum]
MRLARMRENVVFVSFLQILLELSDCRYPTKIKKEPSTSSAETVVDQKVATDFLAYNVVDDIITIKKLRAKNIVLTKKVEYINQLLRELKDFESPLVEELIKRKEYLEHTIRQTHDTLANLRANGDSVLIKKHILQIADLCAAKHRKLVLPEAAAWLRKNDNHYDERVPLDEQLPDSSEVTGEYCFQKRAIDNIKDINRSTKRLVDKLFVDTTKLYSYLKGNWGKETRKPSDFKQPSSKKLEDFDYYGYSPVGPIIPPLDLSWCSSPPQSITESDGLLPVDVSLRDDDPASNPHQHGASSSNCIDHRQNLEPILPSKKKKEKSTKSKRNTNVTPRVFKEMTLRFGSI